MPDYVAFELWRLPTNFFSLGSEEQWRAISEIKVPAEQMPKRRDPCRMTFGEDVLAVAYFLVILGLPVALPVATAGLVVARSPLLKWWVLLLAALALHPIPPFKDWYRRNRMGVILAKYFTMTLVFDMSHPHPMMKNLGTPAVEENPQKIAPMVPLACPHGVLNFGAIVWVFFSRWICGLEQYTAGAPVVAWVPGLRYLCASLWIIPASRKSIKRGLQEHPRTEDKDGKRIDTDVPRRGGMVGVVPDGIAGIFRSKPGSELLYIGKKRGLMRICLEEGAIIAAGWFAGTSDMFHIITDPLGLLEWISRRLQVSLFLFLGRWCLPVPRRVPLTMCSRIVQAEKKAEPTEDEVERLHQEVYGGLARAFNEEMRHLAGYSERELVVL
mmetsp:Transcript_60781/g.172845  ORF Transcript_60781/g.172845 Transcript_60781/m.172845 type:complete len:384 (+) Transcript_60781:90-1241(+)